MRLMADVERLKRALQTVRIPAQPSEEQLVALVADAIQAADIEFEREKRIAPHCRLDLWVDPIAIEVKKGKPTPTRLRKQLERYARCEAIQALLLVVEGAVSMPSEIGGKPLMVVSLSKLWGVAF